MSVNFLQLHSDSRARMYCKQHESMDHHWWGEIFSLHTLGPPGIVQTHRFNWVAFMTTVCHSLMAASCRIIHNVTNWFLKHEIVFTVVQWPPRSTDLKLLEHFWDVVEDILIVECSWQICSSKSVMLSCQHWPENLEYFQHLVGSVYKNKEFS